jgi:hypothetical protein
VHYTFHFRYADGTRCNPLGTTAYAWTTRASSCRSRPCARSPTPASRMCGCACGGARSRFAVLSVE